MIKLGKYKHYKGHMCRVIGVARHSEDHDLELVIYTHPDEHGKEQLYARPKEMFESDVEVNGEIMKRFEYLGE
ncbi:MAG TPA: DUF1653 domain-containing protein [Candidatus Magasanikbacteria bacterium]|nr:DUF1653 domain-containing protein [Candidatus Magasanikbacteria bacterium]